MEQPAAIFDRVCGTVSAALFTISLLSGSLYAQGITTASLSGVVTSEKGEALPSANVIVVHDPTGTRYGTSSRETGAYNIPNMKIGGPYTITVSLLGYKGDTKREVFLG